MKYKRLYIQLTAAALSASLLSACGTSHMSDSEASASNQNDWTTEISAVTTAQTVEPPKPSLPDTPGREVTGDYKDQFVGVWDNPEEHEVWTFRETEVLLIADTEAGEEKSESYTYWFEDDGTQVLLCIFENGDDDPDQYTFAFSGKNLTLYDPVTGEAEESLVWHGEGLETPTPEPSASAATQAPENKQTAAPSQAPSQAPANSPVPSPEPTTEIQLPDNIQLPTEVDEALPLVECALDAVLDGMAFDPADPAFFWAAMGRYLSRRVESGNDGSFDGEYFTVSDQQLRETADDMFSDFDEDAIPDPAESRGLAEKTEAGYRLLWGVTGGHRMELVSFDGISTMELSADGDAYRVVLDDGEIVSIEKL